MWAQFVGLVSGFVLAISATGKVHSARQLRLVASRYGVLPRWLELPAAICLLLIELGLAVLLLAGIGGQEVLIAAAGLFLAFAAVPGVSLARHHHEFPCGCLGARSTIRVGWLSVGLNLVLAAALAGAASAITLQDGTRGMVTSGIAWAAALSLGVLYWLTAYALSVVNGTARRPSGLGGVARDDH